MGGLTPPMQQLKGETSDDEHMIGTRKEWQ
jgi:hypothetical protein